MNGAIANELLPRDVLLFALALSGCVNMFLIFRKADRIVVDKSSGRVVELNNRDYGSTETVSITPDVPTSTDKKYRVEHSEQFVYLRLTRRLFDFVKSG